MQKAKFTNFMKPLSSIIHLQKAKRIYSHVQHPYFACTLFKIFYMWMLKSVNVEI